MATSLWRRIIGVCKPCLYRVPVETWIMVIWGHLWLVKVLICFLAQRAYTLTKCVMKEGCVDALCDLKLTVQRDCFKIPEHLGFILSFLPLGHLVSTH